jgi:hypothetical protein
VELVNDFRIWNIVAHVAFKVYSVASGNFSTASTFWVRGAVRRVLLNPMVMPYACEAAVAMPCSSGGRSYARPRSLRER